MKSANTKELIYPAQVIKSAILHCQRFSNGNAKKPNAASIYKLIKDICCVQIDTINVVHRSHYLTIWSRLGNYRTGELDKLVYSKSGKKLFEYWFHCASLIPYDYFKYTIAKKESYKDAQSSFYREWVRNKENQQLLSDVRKRIEKEGAVRSSDFLQSKPAGGWWNWKPAKKALEFLYNTGDLMVKDRENFHRVYELADRVIPSWVDTDDPGKAATYSYILEISAKALGVAFLPEIASYSYMKAVNAKPALLELIANKILFPVKVQLADKKVVEMYTHADILPLLNRLTEDKLQTFTTTFLNPFDNLFWAKKRTPALWNFTQTLEAYKPEEKRQWGYFSMPILYKGELIGRLEPKLDRENRILYIRYINIEKKINIDDEFMHEIGGALIDFMKFHDAEEVKIKEVTGTPQKAMINKYLNKHLSLHSSMV